MSDKICSIEGCERKPHSRGLCRPHWKPNDPSLKYAAVHAHLSKVYGPAPSCIWSDDHPGRIEWANVSGEYTRELEDYLPMCKSCHAKFDWTDRGREIMRRRMLRNPLSSKPPSPVEQYLGITLVAVYASMNEAARISGVDSKTIYTYLNGKTKVAGGFHWKRVEMDR